MKEDKSDAAASRLEFLRGLAKIAQEEELSELQIESEGIRFTLKAAEILQPPAAGHAPPSVAVATPAISAGPVISSEAVTEPSPDSGEKLLEIVSPMIGVFYRAPSPADANFVEVGDRVEAGQTVALVEAMKVFNEITSESAGVVVEIKANSSDLVETGQVLITLRP